MPASPSGKPCAALRETPSFSAWRRCSPFFKGAGLLRPAPLEKRLAPGAQALWPPPFGSPAFRARVHADDPKGNLLRARSTNALPAKRRRSRSSSADALPAAPPGYEAEQHERHSDAQAVLNGFVLHRQRTIRGAATAPHFHSPAHSRDVCMTRRISALSVTL